MMFAQKQNQKDYLMRLLASLGLILTLDLLANSPAAAQSLDGAAVQKLALQGTWVSEKPLKNWMSWSWSEDNKVCLHLVNPKGKCADTGTWTINGDVMCYELTWWGKSMDVRNNCFTVQAHGDGQFEALYHGTAMVSTFIHFKVLE